MRRRVSARPVIGALGVCVGAVGVMMLAAVLVALLYREGDVLPLLLTALLTSAVGLLAWRTGRAHVAEMGAREGFMTVTLAWVLIPVFGALPYLISRTIPNLTDAYFESVSGLTNTGASILRDVEIMPHGILFWRALTHWIGGLGVIVMALAILPLFGVGGMQLFAAEVAGRMKDRLTPRAIETARLFGKLYAGITLAEIVLLLLAGMPLFDAVCHAFATVASGGFSVKNASIAAYHSPAIDLIITFFMLVAGSSFALHITAIRGRWRAHWRDDEFVVYITTFAIAVVAIGLALSLGAAREHPLAALRHASFNVASVMSCTGFANADFALWPALGQVILLYLMFPGGCAGSTAGAMKTVRVWLTLKASWGGLRRLFHPTAVVQIYHNHVAVRREALSAIQAFVTLYIGIWWVGTLIVAATGLDTVSSMSAVATCMAGCGPGLGKLGPMASYADLAPAAKWTLDLCMLLGRLELFTVMVLFTRTYWRD